MTQTRDAQQVFARGHAVAPGTIRGDAESPEIAGFHSLVGNTTQREAGQSETPSSV